MWRKAYDLLLEWKDREDRMPLIVRGVRQCGKTYILRRFGEEQYGNMVYVNLESEKGRASTSPRATPCSSWTRSRHAPTPSHP